MKSKNIKENNYNSNTHCFTKRYLFIFIIWVIVKLKKVSKKCPPLTIMIANGVKSIVMNK